MKQRMRRVCRFNQSRQWGRYHDPRSPFLALCGELGGLAHLYRWPRRSARRVGAVSRVEIEDEVADMLILILTLCSALEIDPDAAVLAKLCRNKARFPTKRRDLQ